MDHPGNLYIVAIPIGNPRDITLRAMDVLQNVNAVICEEFKEGQSFLKKVGVIKEVITLNEHNEVTQTGGILTRLWNGESLALISDCGTPVFADPGHNLVHEASQSGVKIIPIPGPSSLMAALSVLDFEFKNFYFAGFLPREKEERRKSLRFLRGLRIPVVVMDAPYRLSRVLEDVAFVFGPAHQATLAMDLTLPSEDIRRGTLQEIRKQTGERKAEFVLILH